MRIVLARLLPLAATIPLAACGAVQASHLTDFDAVALNGSWYGAYDRPLPAPGATATARAERPAREDRRQARRDETRDDAADAQRAAAADAVAAARREAPAPQPVAQRPQLPTAREDAAYDPALAAAYVRAVYAANDTSVGRPDGSVADIYEFAREEGQIYHSTPAIGDLVFFHNTFDADGNGRENDWFTHAGIVEDVARDGTIAVLSYVDGRVARTYMNLSSPHAETEGDRTINTVMRPRTPHDTAFTVHLAGQLFSGFASLLGNRAEVVVLDVWQPPGDAVAAR